jgi:hypothetical protein
MIDLSSVRKQVDQLLLQHSNSVNRVEEEETALVRLRKDEKNAIEAQKILQQVAQGVQQIAHERIAGVVTRCLKAVFGPDAYEFKVDFVSKRGKTEAELRFVRDGHVLSPREACGGGTVDIAAMALRLCRLMWTVPARRRILLLDEPLKSVNGAKYRRAVPELLMTLAKEMQLQIIFTTNEKEYFCGKVIRLGKREEEEESGDETE